MNINRQLVVELRELAATGVKPSKLVPVIANRLGVSQSECRLHAIAYFREAFNLSLADAMRIGGAEVFQDGVSDDAELDNELASIIESSREAWEFGGRDQ